MSRAIEYYIEVIPSSQYGIYYTNDDVTLASLLLQKNSRVWLWQD